MLTSEWSHQSLIRYRENKEKNSLLGRPRNQNYLWEVLQAVLATVARLGLGTACAEQVEIGQDGLGIYTHVMIILSHYTIGMRTTLFIQRCGSRARRVAAELCLALELINQDENSSRNFPNGPVADRRCAEGILGKKEHKGGKPDHPLLHVLCFLLNHRLHFVQGTRWHTFETSTSDKQSLQATSAFDVDLNLLKGAGCKRGEKAERKS
ncbi:hypothetical protein B0H19DRAFT_1071651 [Mycena capillaripes]|nr:hypothetical protein B0H19DRAFT_1071651 [Mycena capillaripes]